MCDRWLAFSHLIEESDAKTSQVVIEQSPTDLLEVNTDRDKIIEKTIESLFHSNEIPTGIFVTCDSLTAKLYPILKSIGVNIGKDVEILSCDNQVSLLAGLEPKPVSIDIQAELIGRKAVEQLRWRIMNPDDESQRTIEIQPKLPE
jgi:DNA-binding LacI/PurR family transcriptional regulator